MYLYSLRPPDGRCLVLIQSLSRVSSLSGAENLLIAKRLYANQHPQANPVQVPLREDADLTELRQVCAESGIGMRL